MNCSDPAVLHVRRHFAWGVLVLGGKDTVPFLAFLCLLACSLCLSHFCTHLWWPIIGGPWDRRPRDMEICASYRRSPKKLKSHTRAAHSLGAHVGGHLAIRCEAGNHSCDRFFWLCTANTQNKNKRKASQGLGDPHALSTSRRGQKGHVKPSATLRACLACAHRS